MSLSTNVDILQSDKEGLGYKLRWDKYTRIDCNCLEFYCKSYLKRLDNISICIFTVIQLPPKISIVPF